MISMVTQGKTSLCSPSYLFCPLFTSPFKLTPEALAKADAGMGIVWSQGTFLHPTGVGREMGGTGPALPQSCSLMQMAPLII